MLTEFVIQNYKSFVEETKFSMVKAPKQKGLDYSVFVKKVKGNKLEGLCSSVIYGPNASGKTGLIGAMDTMRSIVQRGNIKNSENSDNPNAAAYLLELIPNNNEKNKPVKFEVEFYEKEILFRYSLILDLGNFLKGNYEKRRVLSEVLKVNNSIVFERKGLDLDLYNFNEIKKYVQSMSKNKEPILYNAAKSTLKEDELFLTNGFRLIYAPDLVKIIIDWFTFKFMVVYESNNIQTIRRYVNEQNKTGYIEKSLHDAVKIFGIQTNELGYIVGDDGVRRLCSVFTSGNVTDRPIAIPAEIYESFGTIRFVNIFPLIVQAIAVGGTLVVDEFDASLHPMALMNIITLFHNDEINKNHAQLIFNTHNPIFLNANLFRRDEIKFVERSEDNAYSSLYTLADFGTSGEQGVRKGEDYMNNYFISKYGAIKNVDFTSIFDKFWNPNKEGEGCN